MKKILLGMVGVFLIVMLVGFGPLKDIKNRIDEIKNPGYEKIEDVRGILDEVLIHIDKTNPAISFENGQLLDSELGVPRFEITSFQHISHLETDDVLSGYMVEPAVTVDNPRVLIILNAVDKEASLRLQNALEKVKSDRWRDYKDTGIWNRYLINESKLVRQGTYLIYVIWEDPTDIVKVFERHVR